jgi:predicted O-methyltransferase YrrM
MRRKTELPKEFADLQVVSSRTWERAKEVKGYLSEREARFLMAASALSPVSGANVEIGSFMGRSTICIASVCKRYGLGTVTAIDPHTAPAPTDPDLGEEVSSWDQFMRNVELAELADAVAAERKYSADVASQWKDPIRFLWIDGDHTYAGAKADVDNFRRFLVPGAVLAMHDVLGTHYGSLRVFVEEILGSADVGPVGFSGSIGWAQYRPGEGNRARFRIRRTLLSIPTRNLIPIARTGKGLVGLNKYRYKFWRPLAPHGSVNLADLYRKLNS